jgi:DNA-binding NarL/FixJ family response regulator
MPRKRKLQQTRAHDFLNARTVSLACELATAPSVTQEISAGSARLACEGQSNQEIADNACLSLPMVKKHLHSVFHKLEVPSRSRLVAMML